jgi:oligosaccharide repeat unit polymerase
MTIAVILNIEYWKVLFSWKAYLIVISGLVVISITEMLIMHWFSNKNATKLNNTARLLLQPISVSHISCMIWAAISIVLTLIVITETDNLGGITLVKVNEDLDLSTIGKIALRIDKCIAYPSLFLLTTNTIRYRRKRMNNKILVIPIVSYIIVTIYRGSRGPIFYLIITAIFYILINDKLNNRMRRININKYIIPIIISLSVFLVLFVGVRSLVKGKEYTSSGYEYITYYLGSPLHLFNKAIDDFEFVYRKYDIKGASVFPSFYRELSNWGLLHKTGNLNDSGFLYIGGNFVGGGNAYTMFSAPYYEFGFIGMLFFFTVHYGIFCLIYYKYIIYKSNLCNDIIILIYGSLYFFLFMGFYVTTSVYLKSQTILECFIMVFVFKQLTSLHGMQIAKYRVRYKLSRWSRGIL